MKEIFTITESNDRRYNITWWTVTLLTLLIPILAISFDLFDKAPKLFVAICIIGLVGVYITRYLFNDHKKIGQLIISDKQISSIVDTKTRILSSIKMLDLKYEGYFGSSSAIGHFPSKDGTCNIITVTYDNGEQEKINIYLDDREKKEDLVKMLKIFSSKNEIKLELGLLVSV